MKTKFSISHKNIAGTTVLTVLILLACLAGFYGANRLVNALDFVTDNAWNAADGSMEASIGIQRQMIELANHVDSNGNSDLMKSTREKIEAAESMTEIAIKSMIDSGLFTEKHISSLKKTYEEYESSEAEVINSYAGFVTGKIDAPNFRSVYNLHKERADKLLSVLSELEEIGDSMIEGASGSIQETKNFVFTTLIVITILGLSVAVVISYLSRKYIALPVARVAEALKQIAEVNGDLTAQLPVNGNDETAELAHYFNMFVGKIRSTIAEVVNTTGIVIKSSDAMLGSSMDATQSVHQQQSETAQVATAINQMTATVEEVARNAAEAARSAENADEEAEKSKRVVSETRDTILMLAREIDGSAKTIDALQRETENIGGVLDVIKGIAEQTNLLALNAAIEAARAGEQGRGFAVVSDEVRILATRTQQSTEEIQGMIEKLQSEANQAVQAMISSRELTQNSVQKSREAEASLDTITSMMGNINDMNHQISTATEEQSCVVSEINRNVTSISIEADKVAEVMEETTRIGHEMTEYSMKLQSLVGQFKV